MTDRRHHLKDFYRRHGVRAALGIFLDWAAIVALVAVSQFVGHPVAYVAAVLLIAGRMIALETKWTHEAIHYNLFRRKAWNDRLEFLYALPVLTSVHVNRETHLDHHRHYLDEKHLPDYGYDDYGITAANKHSRLFMTWVWLIRPLLGYHTLKEIVALVGNLRWSRPFRRSIVLFWPPVVAAFAWLGRLDLLLLYWLVPLFLIRPVFWFWQDMAQHFNADGPLGTRDLHGWFFAVFFANSRSYHGIHHLYPAIPWFRLPRSHRALVAAGQVNEARGFWDLTWQIIAAPAAPAETPSEAGRRAEPS